MSRVLSSAIIQSMYDQETDEVFLVLLTISHSGLASPIRVSSDAVNTTSRSNTYIAYPFEIRLPSEQEGSPPRSTVTIDNVDRTIVNTLRSINSPATFLLEVVTGDDPDTVIVSMPEFKLRNIQGDALQITGELTLEDITQEPFPGGIFSPADFPGLF